MGRARIRDHLQRVSRSATARTCAANVASQGVRGCSQRCERQGFRRFAARIRWTVWGEMAATTASMTSCRASSAQSQWLSERPACSGRSQARRTRCSATSGGKRPGAPGAWTVLQRVKAARPIPIRPGAHDVRPDPHLPRDLIEWLPLGHQQYDPGTPHQANRRRGPPDYPLQGGSARGSQLNYPPTTRARHVDPSTEIHTPYAAPIRFRQPLSDFWGAVLRTRRLDERQVRDRMYRAPTAWERERWHAVWLVGGSCS
jgi:hypothetical protein